MEMETLEIVVPASVTVSDRNRLMLKKGKEAAEVAGVSFKDARIFCRHPTEPGRCSVKEPGFLTFGAHG